MSKRGIGWHSVEIWGFSCHSDYVWNLIWPIHTRKKPKLRIKLKLITQYFAETVLIAVSAFTPAMLNDIYWILRGKKKSLRKWFWLQKIIWLCCSLHWGNCKNFMRTEQKCSNCVHYHLRYSETNLNKSSNPCLKANNPCLKLNNPRLKPNNPYLKSSNPCLKPNNPCLKSNNPCLKPKGLTRFETLYFVCSF